ncbi:MAG: hypothetical protein FJW31_13545 [Acidobacteria bacterium]|nr:hypothetical protein [Acidobacteriota bacterium]
MARWENRRGGKVSRLQVELVALLFAKTKSDERSLAELRLNQADPAISRVIPTVIRCHGWALPQHRHFRLMSVALRHRLMVLNLRIE